MEEVKYNRINDYGSVTIALASFSSFPNRAAIDFSLRARADSLSHRLAKAFLREGLTSTGTW